MTTTDTDAYEVAYDSGIWTTHRAENEADALIEFMQQNFGIDVEVNPA